MLITIIFYILIDLLTLELKFVPEYLEIYLIVFQYWSACLNKVLSNIFPRMALVFRQKISIVSLTNFSVVFLNFWFRFLLSPLPVLPVSGLTSGLASGRYDLNFVSSAIVPSVKLEPN